MKRKEAAKGFETCRMSRAYVNFNISIPSVKLKARSTILRAEVESPETDSKRFFFLIIL